MIREELIDGDGFEQIAKELNIEYCEADRMKDVLNYDISLYHNGDACILPDGMIRRPMNQDRPYDLIWKNIPENVKLIFSQNVGVKDDRIIPLPIGLERCRWNRHIDKHGKILNMMNEQIHRDKLVYLNINPNTNVISRPPLVDAMKDKSWCTNEFYPNGVRFENYISKIKEHKFVFCPEGNGLDCHRTWEALYLGSYPIMECIPFAEYFSKYLPILIVDNWEDITEEFLNEQYEILNNKEWNWGMLKMSYWKQLIQKKVEEFNGI